MPPNNDLWYIRFPDGRILSAATSIVRQHLAAGRLPPGTHLRRPLEQEWRLAHRFPEFADEASPNGVSESHGQSTIASRLEPTRLGQVGVRNLVEELLAALDATVVRCKVQAAIFAGALVGGVVALVRSVIFSFDLDPLGWGWGVAAGAVVALGWLAGVLSRTTFVEVTHLRPSTWKDARQGAGTLSARLAFAFALVGGLVVGLVAIVRWLPGWCLLHAESSGELAWSVAGQVLATLAVPAEVGLWGLLILLLPIGPLLVVEDCSVLAGLWHWLRLVRKSPGRLLVAEGLALAIASGLALPLAALLGALATWAPENVHASAVAAVRAVVAGAILALPVAYLLVANVFIYLSLRYHSPRR